MLPRPKRPAWSIDAGYKVSFNTALSLIETLELAELKGELKKKINQLLKFDVLIIDELGYLPAYEQTRHAQPVSVD